MQYFDGMGNEKTSYVQKLEETNKKLLEENSLLQNKLKVLEKTQPPKESEVNPIRKPKRVTTSS